MLSTLLSSLTSFFSKYFLVSSFLPALAFAFINCAAVYLLIEPFHDWVNRELFQTATRTAFLSTAAAVGVLIVGYVFSGLNGFLRGLLEGKWPDVLRRGFVPLEERRLRAIEQRLERAAKAEVDLTEEAPTWQQRMREARLAGMHDHPGHNAFQGTEPVVTRLHAMRTQRAQNRLIPAEDLRAAVADMSDTLRLNDVRLTAGTAGLLDEYHSELSQLITFATENAAGEHLRLHNERYSKFGSTDLAPTRMGNVANTVQSYAVRRYDCNFEMIWSQLQRSVQKDANAYATLQDAKAQLDFLIACSWLTAVSTALWIVVLASSSVSLVWFLAVALGGPLLAYLWYRAAAENYRSFGDVMMTSFDVFRFDVLKDIRLAPPADVEEERRIWDSLHRLSRYGEEMNFRYQHPKSP